MSGISIGPSETNTFAIVDAIRQLAQGRSNATSTFTLAAGVTQTVVKAPNVSKSSTILWSARTLNAAASLLTMFVSTKAQGTFTMTHNSTADIDRTFDFVAFG